MGNEFRTDRLADGLTRIVDALGYHAYLVEGQGSALLVDSCGGFGNLRTQVEALTDLPVEVALTHGHFDHAAGSYWFGEAYLSDAEGDCWPVVEEHAQRVREQVVQEGLYPDDVPFATRDGIRPAHRAVTEGNVFDLGSRTVTVFSLPGHTAGSVGYLIDDLHILLSGDAVTPVMCLFLDDSLGIEAWRETLAKMAGLPFDTFYTGHHDHAFAKDDLASFDDAAVYAQSDRGMEWCHSRLQDHRGILHIVPNGCMDVDSPDFRAVIEQWHELPQRKRHRKG